jgi:creatinine amidohydrolase
MERAPKRHWADLTADEFRALDAATIAVLPVAAIEQHGPHLPLSVDRDLTEAILARALDHVPADLPVLVLPMTAVGLSLEHVAFPGTLSLSAETLIRMFGEIGASVARARVRKLVFFNGHGGNVPILDIAAREARARHGMLTAVASWTQFGAQDGLLDAHELRHGVHAGEMETAMMLAVRGHLVDMSKAKDFPSQGEAWARDLAWFGVGGRPVRTGWLIHDLNQEGACGDAAAARAETGAAIVEEAARRFAEFLCEFHSLPADGLNAWPDSV